MRQLSVLGLLGLPSLLALPRHIARRFGLFGFFALGSRKP